MPVLPRPRCISCVNFCLQSPLKCTSDKVLRQPAFCSAGPTSLRPDSRHTALSRWAVMMSSVISGDQRSCFRSRTSAGSCRGSWRRQVEAPPALAPKVTATAVWRRLKCALCFRGLISNTRIAFESHLVAPAGAVLTKVAALRAPGCLPIPPACRIKAGCRCRRRTSACW